MKNAITMFFSGFIFFLGYFLFWLVVIGGIFGACVMIYRHFKYGYNYLDAFRPRKKFESNIPVILASLKTININMRIIVPQEYYADLILVSDGGIFLISVFPYQDGTVEYGESNLTVNVAGKLIKIPNPYRGLEADTKKIKAMFPQVPIYSYVVFGMQNTLKFTYDGSTKTIRYKNLNYQIKRDYNETGGNVSSTVLKNINQKVR